MDLVCVILVLVSIRSAHSEWIQIAQNPKHTNQSHLLALNQSIITADAYARKDVDDLKYEDLIDIVGPEFQDTFEKYLENHRNKIAENYTLSESDRSDSVPKTASFSEVLSQQGDVQISSGEKQIFYVDPWAIYDTNPAESMQARRLWMKFNQTDPNGFTTSVMSVDPSDLFVTSNHDHNQNVASHNRLQFSLQQAGKPKIRTTTEASASDESSLAEPTTAKSVQKPKIILKKLEPFNPFDFSHILQFMKNVQKSFALGTMHSINGKIKYLEQFKNQLVTNIEKRLALLWPSNGRKSRDKRGIFEGNSSHDMDIHGYSIEVALMTISFLTLAVFLIKLVLQAIYTIKSKHYAYNSLQTMTSAQSPDPPIKIIKKHRNARRVSLTSADVHMMATVLSSVDKLRMD